jgi:ketosteroid isomerase-like protein
VSLLIIIWFAASCNEKKEAITDTNTQRIELMNTDKAFSSLSEEKGMKAAFIEYIDSNGVLLKPDHLPIAGANAIDYLIQQNDTAFTLTWQPHNAVVAKSGDIGYTYGIYSFQPKLTDTILYGTYVSIWKKQSDGSWKFVLDSGNEGIGDH